MAHVRFVVFKVLFAFALLAGLDGGLVGEFSEAAAEWVEEHKLPTTPPHPRRQAHRMLGGFEPYIPPAVSAPPNSLPLSPVGHTFSHGLRAPMRC